MSDTHVEETPLDHDDLDDLFNDGPTDIDKTNTAQVEVDEQTETVEGEEETVTPPVTEEHQNLTDREKAFLAKADDEKAKRQALEAQLSNDQPQRQAQEAPEPDEAPDVFEDPEAYTAWVNKKFESLQSSTERQAMQTRVDVSTQMVISQHDDAETVMKTFEDACIKEAKESPDGISQMARAFYTHPTPGLFAYNKGKELTALAKIGGDPDTFVARTKEEAYKEGYEAAKKELDDNRAARDAVSDQLPRSLVTEKSEGSRSSGAQEADDDLATLLSG